VAISEMGAIGFLALTQNSFGDFSRSVFVIDALICSMLIMASRFAERALARALGLIRDRNGVRVIVVGAGGSGRSLLRELRETPGTRVVAFVDDDPLLRKRRLQGVPVLGGLREIERILARTHPETVFVTIPDADREQLDAVVAACAATDIVCRFVRRETDLDPRVVLGAAPE
jgi:FlaA1/EpsC-like NDP-sugar epimerase